MGFRIIPLIILGIMSCISLGIAIEKHGKPKQGREDAWVSLIAWVIQWGLILWAII